MILILSNNFNQIDTVKKLLSILIFIVGFFAISVFLEFQNHLGSLGLIQSTSDSHITPKSFQNKKKNHRLSPDQPNQFSLFYNEIRTRDGERKPGYSMNYKIHELKKARRNQTLKKSISDQLQWQERGPGNVGGRTRGLIVHPGDSTHNTWYAGSVGGGIWKTINGGESWVNKTPDLPNLATTTLAMAPSNYNIIYAGTGEGFYNFGSITGNGLFKSLDSGETWQQLISTADKINFQNINRIIVDPKNENILLIAVNAGFFQSDEEKTSGIYRSMDGGENWQQVYDSSPNRVQQIVANPLNFKTQYACINSIGILKSTDGGLNWDFISNEIEGIKRIELAIAPTDTFRIYAAAEVNSNTSALYISEDGGIHWRLSVEESNKAPNWLGGQGWYDNAITVHPFDEDIVFLGGINIWQAEFERHDGIGEILLKVEQNNTSFLSFFNFGATYANGGLIMVDKEDATNIDKFDYVSVELRFGPGKSQKAHRFSAPDRSGVPPENYVYEEYSDVPFEVWDLTNNRQIMVSYRDRKNDGQFNLIPLNFSDLGREYIFINSVPYDPINPDPNIGVNGGHIYKNIYFIWPVLQTGATWDPGNLPESTLLIKYGAPLLFKRSTELTNWFTGRSNPDHSSGFFPFVHADHHNLITIPIDEANNQFWLIDANDGGIEISKDDGINWSKTLNGYNTTQHYGVDKKPGENIYISGMQDNGTWQSSADADELSQWQHNLDGDGFETSWHYMNPHKIVASLQFGSINRSEDGGLTWNPAVEGLLDFFPFFTTVAKSNSDPDLLFTTGSRGIWRSDNFAQDWILSSIPANDWGFFDRFTPAKISMANPQIVWAGGKMSDSKRIHVSTDGGITFVSTSNYEPKVLGTITGLATHPSEDSTAYALFSFAKSPKILRTTDLGTTWQDISGFFNNSTSTNGFPDVATYCLLVLPHVPNTIWVGTEIGLFESTDNGVTWHFADNRLPAVSIWQMSIVDDQIIVATHGRGIWTVTIPELHSFQPPIVTLPPRLNPLIQTVHKNVIIDLSLRSEYDSTHVFVNGEILAKLFYLSVIDTSFRYNPIQTGEMSASLLSFKDGKPYKSSQRRLEVLALNSAQNTYANNFNEGTEDFTGIGFDTHTHEGFADGAIHSLHPYLKSGNITYQLLTPIVVRSKDASLTFDEIALVEPGDEDAEFGEANFRDYVIVEGSTDLIDWRALTNGYDARLHSDWLSAYEARSDGIPSLFKNHTINLLDTFSPGDQVVIRFRFFSDDSKNGWGWAIDNLEIQDTSTLVETANTKPHSFTLKQNFPNPFNPNTEIQYILPNPAKVWLNIFNVKGQKVRTIEAGSKQDKGIYSINWNGKNDIDFDLPSGLYIVRLQADQFVQARKMTLIR